MPTLTVSQKKQINDAMYNEWVNEYSYSDEVRHLFNNNEELKKFMTSVIDGYEELWYNSECDTSQEFPSNFFDTFHYYLDEENINWQVDDILECITYDAIEKLFKERWPELLEFLKVADSAWREYFINNTMTESFINCWSMCVPTQDMDIGIHKVEFTEEAVDLLMDVLDEPYAKNFIVWRSNFGGNILITNGINKEYAKKIIDNSEGK